jgi:hypothetical protein
MRRLEFLITQVRNSTDNKDVNGISDAEIAGYFNDAQRYITSIIFKNNPYADLFKTQLELPADPTGEYTIPDDCYSINALSMVEARFADTSNNKGYSRIKPISESEFSYIFGYTTRDNKVLISGQNDIAQLQNVRITYFRQLPTLAVRQGRVASIGAGAIYLNQAPPSLATTDDYISTVDAKGDQVVNKRFVSSISGVQLTLDSVIGITTSQYAVAGYNACNKSLLPDVCETYLLDYVKQRIYTRNNYSDGEKQAYFTEKQENEIVAIFSKNKKDDDSIPVTDVEFLFF